MRRAEGSEYGGAVVPLELRGRFGPNTDIQCTEEGYMVTTRLGPYKVATRATLPGGQLLTIRLSEETEIVRPYVGRSRRIDFTNTDYVRGYGIEEVRCNGREVFGEVEQKYIVLPNYARRYDLEQLDNWNGGYWDGEQEVMRMGGIFFSNGIAVMMHERSHWERSAKGMCDKSALEKARMEIGELCRERVNRGIIILPNQLALIPFPIGREMELIKIVIADEIETSKAAVWEFVRLRHEGVEIYKGDHNFEALWGFYFEAVFNQIRAFGAKPIEVMRDLPVKI